MWLSTILLFVMGNAFMVQIAASNTIIQTIVEDDMRGRVMSFFIMAFLGTVPFGSLLAGRLALQIGAPATLMAGGSCCLLGALWFARGLPELRRAIRPIYIKKGILPEISVQGLVH
jgi:predicted MFS family arabinose efflux permease